MRTEDVLAAVGTGAWLWDNVTDSVELDAVAAGLLGLPPEPTTTSSGIARACYHAADYVEMAAGRRVGRRAARRRQGHLVRAVRAVV
jgi:hypothetical protein